MNATYNITTNKIKFYPPPGRLDAEQDKRRHACNFVWYPGQKCFAAAWSPNAVDFVESFGIEIEADDTPDNVEARAERFGKYAGDAERASENASEYANIATTEKRAERALSRATSEAERAEYWNRRIHAAIRHAEYKDRPDVIARRIKGLEAEQRKHTREHDEANKFLEAWQNVTPGDYDRAVYLANYGSFYVKRHDDNKQESAWYSLTTNQITPAEARAAALALFQSSVNYQARWIEHLNTRIEYEKAYLEAVGGSELLAPKERAPRRVAKAPDDGIKKGDTVMYHDGYYGQGKEHTAKVVSLGAHYVRVERPADAPDYYPETVKVMRKFCKKVES